VGEGPVFSIEFAYQTLMKTICIKVKTIWVIDWRVIPTNLSQLKQYYFNWIIG
jgi:hypothetical protein